MKRSLFTQPLKQTLLAVPAAALMLGSAQAQTTVGINFQGSYGGSYAGAPVTTTDFGVAAADWFTDSGDLPGGFMTAGPGAALSVSWSSANTWCSGLYPDIQPDNSTPGPLPGNGEVLWGYLDDGDPGYSVTVSGLNSVFPHGYVVQTIGAESGAATFSDSTVSDGVTTDSLVYSNYWHPLNFFGPPFVNSGTAGISTPSDVFTSDFITISGAPRAGSVRAPLCGFIITDKAVVSLDPASGVYVPGQAVNLNVVAIGIGTLSYQWRSNGIPISGATTASYTIPSIPLGSFNYDVIVTNLYGSATSGVAVVSAVVPAALTWDADTGTPGAQDGSGTWDNGTTANWWNGSSDIAWSDLGNATFGSGGTGAYTVTVANNVTISGLTFNSGNYTLTGAGITLVGTPTITANTNAAISLALSGNSGLTKTGNGALSLATANTFTGDLTVNGGKIGGGTAGGSSYLGAVSGGRTITVNAGASIVLSNNNVFGGGGYSAAILPAVVINGGTFNSTRYNSIGNVTLNSGATLTQSASDSGSYQGYQFLGNITVGGASASTISTGNGKANHLLGAGVNIFNVADATGDSNADLIVSTPLMDGSGDYAGVGSLVKTGAGTMVLSAVNTYSGTTTVSNGALVVSGQLTGNAGVLGNITLNDGAELDVVANSVGSTISASASSLILGSSGSGNVMLGFASPISATTAPIVVGSLAVINPVKVNISGSILTTGQYPLIQYYGGESGSGAFTLGSLPGGVSATLVDDHTSSVYLNVTATPVQTEVWNGTPNGNWDIDTTANWLVGATPAKFVEGNLVTFDDSASGTTSITLNTVVHPSVVTFNNSTKNYTISGSGAIAGSTAVAVNGTGKVILNNTNTYTGGTSINNGGTLAISTDASLGAGALTLNYGLVDITGTTAFTSSKSIVLNGSGEIQVDNPAGATLNSSLTGGGSLTKSGNGTLALSVQQTYTGGTTVNGGILDLTGGGGSAGTIRGQVTVNAGATLRLSTGDATGYTFGPNSLGSISLDGGTLNVNSTANQTLGGATIIMTGGAITGLSGANLDFFGGSSGLNVYPSSVPSTISGVALSPLRQGPTIFSVAAGTTTNGIDLDISSVLRVSPSGDAAGSVLIKADTGTMRLSAVNTYQGGTEVQAGTLLLTGRLIGGGFVQVDDGATLNVSSGLNSAIVTTNDLTFGFGGSLTLGFANVNSPTVPILSVGNVNLNDAVTVNITGNVAVGQFPLIKYSGTKTGAGSFTLGALPSGVSATLVDNTANKSLDLHVTGAPLSLITDISGGTNYAYAGANYTLSIVAGGNAPLGYQWYKDGAPVNGATTTTLTLTRLTTDNTGGYYAIVTNASGSISSSTNHLVVLPSAGYTALAIATGPTAYWPLNESAGPTAVDYMNGHNGSYGGGVIFGVPGAVAGDSGTSTAITASAGNYVTVPYSADLNPAGAFTIEGWFNPSAQASAGGGVVCPIASAEFATNRKGWLIYQTETNWNFRTYNANGANFAVSIYGAHPVAVGSWTHLACVWDGTKGYLYENGVLAATSAATTYVPSASALFTIGARSDGAFNNIVVSSPGDNVSIDDVAFYNRALTPQEIQTHVQNRPSLTINQSGGKVILSWIPQGGGTLVTSPTVDGTYTNLPTATSPWTNTPTGNQFFRVKF
jgi:autotransporter-associated beta strand protein